MNLQIILINLANRPKRLINTLKELRKCGLSQNVIRIEACDSESAKEQKFKYISEKSYNNIERELKSTIVLPTWGAVGCAISHYKAWEFIDKNNIKLCLIIEDDIQIRFF